MAWRHATPGMACSVAVFLGKRSPRISAHMVEGPRYAKSGCSVSSADRESTTCRGWRMCARSTSPHPGASLRTPCASDASARRRSSSCPRHGRGHKVSPSDINYRANIDAMKRAGVTDIVSLSACGSFREALHPGFVSSSSTSFVRSHPQARILPSSARAVWRMSRWRTR